MHVRCYFLNLCDVFRSLTTVVGVWSVCLGPVVSRCFLPTGLSLYFIGQSGVTRWTGNGNRFSTCVHVMWVFFVCVHAFISEKCHYG